MQTLWSGLWGEGETGGGSGGAAGTGRVDGWGWHGCKDGVSRWRRWVGWSFRQVIYSVRAGAGGCAGEVQRER